MASLSPQDKRPPSTANVFAGDERVADLASHGVGDSVTTDGSGTKSNTPPTGAPADSRRWKLEALTAERLR